MTRKSVFALAAILALGSLSLATGASAAHGGGGGHGGGGRGHGGSSDITESHTLHFHDILPVNGSGAYPRPRSRSDYSRSGPGRACNWRADWRDF